MTVAMLVAHGKPETAFELRSTHVPVPTDSQVLVRVEGFGLNYADVMARLGFYPDCPPLPAVLGYEVVGRVERVGAGVTRFRAGDRVLSFTRFGAYAEYAVAEELGTVAIEDSVELGKALALGTQYTTAFYCAEEILSLHPGDHVLVHAAAGGVGTGLVQLAKRRDCIVFGTASTSKLEHLASIGVDHPIDYRSVDFAREVVRLTGDRGLDVIFDPIGGNYTRKGLKLLGAGGRLVLLGASKMTNAANIFSKLRVGSGFGIFHPLYFAIHSKSLLGVNMLRIADSRPWILERCLESVVALAEAGELDPVVGREFTLNELAAAHRFMESRQSVGKIAIRISQS